MNRKTLHYDVTSDDVTSDDIGYDVITLWLEINHYFNNSFRNNSCRRGQVEAMVNDTFSLPINERNAISEPYTVTFFIYLLETIRR